MNRSLQKKLASLGLAAVMATAALTGCGSSSAAASTTAKAGEYTASAQGFGGQVTATVTVGEDGSIAAIEVDTPNETPDIGGKAAPKLAEMIVENQSLAVDAVSGASGTSKGVLEAVEAALTEAGFDIEALKNKTIEKNGEDEEVSVDVVIVGAGGSGTAAALAAAETGAKVLIIEKTNSVGGNSKLASGMFAVESSMQKAEGLDLNADEAVSQLLEFNQYLSNGPLTRAIIEKSASTIDWLQSYGVELYLPDTTTQFDHYENLYKWKGYHKYVDSSAAFDSMYTALDNMGAEVRLNTSVQSILQDDNGAVIGITATKEDGGLLTVNAGAVIMATGGYGGDKDRVYENLHTDLVNDLGVSNNGEGIDLALEAGGMAWDSSTALLHAAQLAGSETAAEGYLDNSLTQLLLSPLLWVDGSGTRIGNEDAIYDTVFWSNVAYSANGRYFIVVDEATLEDYTKGTSILISDAGPGACKDPADFVALADEAVAAGSAFSASTLAELAEATGMEASELEATVASYNTMVESKVDTEYGKSAESLVYPVSTGKFYAFEARAVFLGTVGGVKVDENLRVIDKYYDAIPGLYVVGASAGGYYTNGSYPPYEGLACGFAYNSGRIAGEHAAKFIQE